MARYCIKLCLLYFVLYGCIALFYQCTNISCSDEYLWDIALTEALQLLPPHSLDPLALLFHVDPGWDMARAWTPKQSTQPFGELLLVHPF